MTRDGSSKLLLVAVLVVIVLLLGAIYTYMAPGSKTVTVITVIKQSNSTQSRPTSPPTTSPETGGGTTSSARGPSESEGSAHTTTPRATSQGSIEATLISPSRIWFAVREVGKVLQYDSSSGRVTPVFDAYPKWIGAFTPHPSIGEKVFYTDTSKAQIILHLLPSHNEAVAFEHSTYIRCIRFGNDQKLYFSEAWGAGENGRIYKVEENGAVPYLEVPLDSIHSYWAGNFEFAPDGTLFISSGNHRPSWIFSYKGGRFTKLAKLPIPVMGMDYVEGARIRTADGERTVAKGLLFADFESSIYLFDIDTGETYLIFRDDSLKRITDVAVAP